MKYTAIFSDFDGTLFRDDHTISETNKKAIKEYESKGGKFIISTGRLFSSIYPYLIELGLHGEVITTQGAEIYDIDSKRRVLNKTYNLAEALHVINFVEKQKNVIPLCYIDGEIFCSYLNEYSEKFSQLVGLKVYYVNQKLSEYFLENNSKPSKILAICAQEYIDEFISTGREMFEEKFELTKSQDFLVEILNTGINKGSAVKYLCQLYNIDKANIICVGDSENDNSMIKYAGLGIAVENAFDVTKKVADYISEKNDDDAIAKIIKRFCYE